MTNLVFLIGVYICLTVSFLAGQNYQQNHVKVNAKEDYEYDILERIIIVLVAISNSIVLPILFAQIWETHNLITFSENKEVGRKFDDLYGKLKKLKTICYATFVPFILINLSIYWSMRKSFEGVVSVISQFILIISYFTLMVTFAVQLYKLLRVVHKDEKLPWALNVNTMILYFLLVIVYLITQFLTILELAKPFINGVILNDYS